ncbi:MAG TPA: hypothetical protein DDY98_06080, partial [Ruminococcaceae bacterium]|nr:hypothetical protein [Oscillospiraceae bacterium]
TESVTGTEIDFGIGELETDSHTHSNKNLLDSLADTNFGGVFRFCKGVDPVDKIPIKNCGNNATLVLYGGVYNKFGNSSSPAGSIAVTGFYCSGGGAQEYILDFYSGSTPTTLTLPDSVQWANELTIEANKHYQVSIVDNIALWTAVGTEEDEDE